MNKSAAQTLFDRIMTTWIIPEIEERANQNLVNLPFNLTAALIIWEKPRTPQILLNDEADASIDELQVTTTKPTPAGQPVNPALIKSLKQIKLISSRRTYPFIFLIQANEGLFYILSKAMLRVIHTREFEVLKKSLATEGVKIGSDEDEVQVYLDVIRNHYDYLSTPALKRQEVIRLGEALVEDVKKTATARVKRHLRLPTLLVHRDDEFLPLLYETRRTYIDGHFFSCIASAATTADRMCNRLSRRYDLSLSLQKWMLEQTLGNKIPKLRAEKVITKDQEALLSRLNRVRNRHLHPRRTISMITLKRDALMAVQLLHQLLEGTFSVYRDHTFAQGRIVPKRLV